MTVSLTDTVEASVPGSVLAHSQSFLVLCRKFLWGWGRGEADRRYCKLRGARSTSVKSQETHIRKSKLLIPYLLSGVCVCFGEFGACSLPSHADGALGGFRIDCHVRKKRFDVFMLHVAVVVAVAVAVCSGSLQSQSLAVAVDVGVPVPRVQGTAQ